MYMYVVMGTLVRRLSIQRSQAEPEGELVGAHERAEVVVLGPSGQALQQPPIRRGCGPHETAEPLLRYAPRDQPPRLDALRQWTHWADVSLLRPSAKVVLRSCQSPLAVQY